MSNESTCESWKQRAAIHRAVGPGSCPSSQLTVFVTLSTVVKKGDPKSSDDP